MNKERYDIYVNFKLKYKNVCKKESLDISLFCEKNGDSYKRVERS